LQNFRKRLRLILRIAVQLGAQTLQGIWRELVFTHNQCRNLPESAAWLGEKMQFSNHIQTNLNEC
jgi:hypothetical protein